MITVLLISVLAGIAVPHFVRAREHAQLGAILNNLRIVESAKDQWAMENRRGTGDVPADTDLSDYMKNTQFPPNSVVGETYNINPVGAPPNAVTPVRLGTYLANSSITVP